MSYIGILAQIPQQKLTIFLESLMFELNQCHTPPQNVDTNTCESDGRPYMGFLCMLESLAIVRV